MHLPSTAHNAPHLPRRARAVRLLPFALAALQALPAAAQPLLSEADFFAEIPRYFSVSRLPQAPADAPGAVTVIDREMIRASGAREVAELFRLVPGFVVGYSGSRPVVAYHGLSGEFSQRMQILLDGRSLYAPYLFGGADWNNLPVNLDDIERIEVHRGSNSASYGANAFLGVAHIITRSAAQSGGLHLAARHGSGALRDLEARWGAAQGALAWRLSAGSRHDDGLDGRFDSRQRNHAALRAEWQLSAIDELSLQLGGNNNRIGVGEPRNVADPARHEQSESGFALLRWRHAPSPDEELSLAVSRTEERWADGYFIPVTATRGLTVDLDREATRDHLEYQHFLALAPGWRASWGAEHRRDRLQALQLFNTERVQGSESSRAYLNAEWRPAERWTFNFGGMLERDSISGTHLAPRLVANWKPAPAHAFKLGYSEAFRTPSLFEQRSDWRFVFEGQTIDIRFLSRGGLEPERVRATEFNYLGDYPAFGASLDLRVFHERITGLISPQRFALPPGSEFDPSSGAFDLRNAESATVSGAEYQLRLRPREDLTLILGQMLARRSASADYVVDSIPASSAHLLALWQVSDNLSASLAHYRMASLRWIGEAASIEPLRRTDLRLDRRLRLGDTRNTVSLLVRNAEGGQQEFLPDQTAERRVWLQLTVAY